MRLPAFRIGRDRFRRQLNGDRISAQDFLLNFGFAAICLFGLLLSNISPTRSKVATHLLAERRYGLWLQITQFTEHRAHPIQIKHFGAAVTRSKCIGQQSFIDIFQIQFSNSIDPCGQLDQITFLFGTSQRDRVCFLVEAIHVDVRVALAFVGVRVVVASPYSQELMNQVPGNPGMTGRDLLDVRKRLVLLVDSQVQVGHHLANLSMQA